MGKAEEILDTIAENEKRQSKGSPGLRFFLIAKQNGFEAAPHSWERWNASLQAVLSVAISMGLRFDPDDLQYIEQLGSKSYRSNSWMGADRLEGHYTQAIADENKSFCVAYETWRGWEAIRGDDVESTWIGGRTSSRRIHRKRERLSTGLSFVYRGERLKVTSRKADAVVACSYRPAKPGTHDYQRKIKKRYTLTAADIQADRKARKTAQKVDSKG